MRRGDVVLVADGKPRSAVIVQADHFTTSTMVLVCPLTSALTDNTLFRVTVEPECDNGLRTDSQLMVDRVGAVRRDRVGGIIGHLNDDKLEQLDFALTLMFDLLR